MTCGKVLLLAVATLGAVCAAPQQKDGYSYPEPTNGLYLPPPPDQGGPINPGGSSNYETGIRLPEPPKPRTTTTRRPRPTTTQRPYRPPVTTQRPYRPPVTTQRPTTARPTYRPRPTTTRAPYRPRPTTARPTPPPRASTTRPTYRPRPTTTRRPITTPRNSYIPPNLVPDASGPSGTGVRLPTTRRPSPSPKTAAPAGSKMMHMSRPYEFGYAVDDDNENNSFSQKETSDGMVITGEYRWEMPDGRTQIVTYLADWAKGYYADVRYE